MPHPFCAGVQSQPRQWESWPRHVLNPYFLSLSKDKEKVKATRPYSEDTVPSLTEEDSEVIYYTCQDPHLSLCSDDIIQTLISHSAQ